jgi:hypothetical protein
MLMLGLFGVTVLAVGEPCSSFEQTSSDHDSCPPTCVTCGCCAQAVEPTAVEVEAFPKPSPVVPPPLVVRFPAVSPLGILHVSKSVHS